MINNTDSADFTTVCPGLTNPWRPKLTIDAETIRMPGHGAQYVRRQPVDDFIWQGPAVIRDWAAADSWQG